jgi:hypothetical protein
MKRIILTIFYCGFCVVVIAGEDNIPLGARSAAMANASVSLSDVWSTQQNQAGLAFVRNISGSAYYENKFMLKELNLKAGSIALPIHGGTFGLLVSNFGYHLYSENKFAASFAKAFGEKFSIGISMDYMNVLLADGYGRKDMFVAEMGVLSKPLKNLTIGAHVYNPTRTKIADYNSERIPTIFRFGGNYTFSDKVLLTIETEKDIAYDAVFKASIEYKPIKELFLRAGVSSNPIVSSFGFGILLNSFQIDVSTNYHQVLGFNPQLGLTYINNKKQTTNI